MSGRRVEQPDRLAATVILPTLDADALVLAALASIYRREGPLSPTDWARWRIRSRREETDWQIAFPVRRWVKKEEEEASRF